MVSSDCRWLVVAVDVYGVNMSKGMNELVVFKRFADNTNWIMTAIQQIYALII